MNSIKTSDLEIRFNGSGEKNLLNSIERINPLGRISIVLLAIVVFWGLFAYIFQITHGLGVTAMRDIVSWGLYIATFVFFIGISHAGTLMSAILRVTNAEWRRPLTRMAEVITVVALMMGGLMPIIDMGRPDRVWHLLIYGRIQSPLVWDVLCITTYLCGSMLFLYFPAIPDIALCRDRFARSPHVSKFRKWIYRKLSLGWKGTTEQWRLLEKSMNIMTILIIPIAVSVHTVVSWIFATTLRPGWNSTIFGPYFVVGAIMSGTSALIIATWAFRKAYHLEEYITPYHFKRLGQILLAFIMLYAYFNINEYWVPAYKMATPESRLLDDLFYGSYSPLYWTLQIGSVLIPMLMLAFSFGRRLPWILVAAFLNVIGAWIKRYLIVIPTLQHPFAPIQDLAPAWSNYFPTWVEWSIIVGSLAGFILVYILISRLVPIISIWEVEEGKKLQSGRNGDGAALIHEKDTTQHEIKHEVL